MTTPDQHTPHTQAAGSTEEPGSGAAPMGPPSGQAQSPAAPATESSAGHAEASTAKPRESSAGRAESSAATTESRVEGTDSGTDEPLFGDLLSGLRSRWDDVQASFVDDPRQCVQKADHLVSDVVDRLTTGFAQARAQLEEQWARGEEASTEDLRQALKRYREFFHRLLSVDEPKSEHPGTVTPGSRTGTG